MTTDIFSNIEPPETLPSVGPHAPKDVVQSSESAYEWERSHRRPNTPGAAIRGFGPSGWITLYLPPSSAKTRVAIVNGQPVKEVLPNAMTSPEMIRLRMDTISALKSPEGVLRFDLALCTYACTIIKQHYDVSDQDLTMLLSGVKWHLETVRHLLGGDDHVDVVLRQKATAVVSPERQIVYVPVHTPPAPAKRRWLNRLFNLH